MKTPALRNAVEMSELNQKFEALSHERRFYLAIGDSAKVCAVFGEVDGISGERFWVGITAADAGCYQGTVDNELTHSASHGLHFGDLISFDHKHVYEVVLQSELEKLRPIVHEEIMKPGFRNVTARPSDENQS